MDKMGQVELTRRVQVFIESERLKKERSSSTDLFKVEELDKRMIVLSSLSPQKRERKKLYFWLPTTI